MKHLLSTLILMPVLLWPLQVFGDQTSEPFLMVKKVASATFERMKSEQERIKQDPETLRIIVEQELMPHVDYAYSALTVLGNHANTLPKEKLAEYVEAFRLYLTFNYAASLTYYTNQTVEFVPEKHDESKKTASILALIKQPGRENIDVVFKVRKNKAGEWKAYDLIAEGVSLVQSKRAEFQPIVRQQGIDLLIKMINDKNSVKLQVKTST